MGHYRLIQRACSLNSLDSHISTRARAEQPNRRHRLPREGSRFPTGFHQDAFDFFGARRYDSRNRARRAPAGGDHAPICKNAI